MTPADLAAFRALEAVCWRAPSAHNTQPWTLTYHDDRIAVGWDPADALPASDPTGRDLRLSLGAFVETCLIAAADAGLAVTFVADLDEPRRRIGWLESGAKPYTTPFDAATILRRTSGRVPYHTVPVDGETLSALRVIAAGEGGDVREIDIPTLRPLVTEADRYLFGTPPIIRELRTWLRLSRRHPRYRRDGLSDRALALRRWEALGLRAVLSGAAYPVLRRAGLARVLAAATPLKPGGSVLALVGPAASDPHVEVAFGRVLQRMWLALADRGMATHPLSEVIDAPRTGRALHDALGLTPDQRVFHLARTGRPHHEPARSARRVGAGP